MDTPSFLEGSSVDLFPFAPPDGVTAERTADGSGPDAARRVDDGKRVVKRFVFRIDRVGDKSSVRERSGNQRGVPEHCGTLPRNGHRM